MDQDIKITAEPKDDSTCRFIMDRPIYPNGSIYFGEKISATGSPLAEKIYAIDGVQTLLIQDNVVTVSAVTNGNWMPVAKQVGEAIRTVINSGDKIVADNVLANMPAPDAIRQKVLDVLNNEINPAVASHGGWVELIDIKGNEVFIKMGGGCQGCGMADVTLKQGVEKSIRLAVPEVGAIMDTTDHASGRNPYYQPAK